MPSRQQRIAILSPLFSNAGNMHGGITPVVSNLAKGFAGRGFAVGMLVRLPKQANLPAEPLGPGVRIIDLGTSHRLSTAFAVARYLRRERPAALLAAGHRFNLAAAWVNRFSHATRTVLSVHNNVSSEAQRHGRLWTRRRFQAISRFYRWADGIVTVSKGVADDLLAHTTLPADRVRVIHNPVVTPELLARGEEPLDHPWFAPDSPPVILGVGRLSPQKRFDILLRAFAQVRQQRPCRLLILGEGDDRTELENLATELGVADDVSLPGFVPNSPAFMKRAAVFALSSAWEGLPTVLIEALAAGTPIVATDCPSGPREILASGRYGHLVPVGDSDALAQGILQSLQQPLKPDDWQAAIRPYQPDTVIDQYLDALGLD